jgi:hypothetical protein
MDICLPDDKALLICGSLNANIADRKRSRSDILPCHIYQRGYFVPIEYFNDWGELGVSSFAFSRKNSSLFFVSTGNDLYKFDLNEKVYDRCLISDIKDIHEMEISGDVLWISNTGFDEIIGLNVIDNEIITRISLSNFSGSRFLNGDDNSENGHQETIDRFHCNYVFHDYQGDLSCLVHHVTGKQLIKREAPLFIKKHGNGGVINLTRGSGISLKLSAPHNVRKIDGGYWICDSGKKQTNIYDESWKLIGGFSNRGWSRGMDFSEEDDLVFIGISETRKRYLRIFQDEFVPNMIEIHSISEKRRLGEILCPECIEQVNNIYLINGSTAEKLLNL